MTMGEPEIILQLSTKYCMSFTHCKLYGHLLQDFEISKAIKDFFNKTSY